MGKETWAWGGSLMKFTEEHKEKISMALRGKPSGMLGKKHTKETKEKMRISQTGKDHSGYALKRGEQHHNWKGDNTGYASMHRWVRKNLPKPDVCPYCGQLIELEVAYADDIPNKDYSHYKRDLVFWRWTCVSCHMKADRRARRRNKKVI